MAEDTRVEAATSAHSGCAPIFDAEGTINNMLRWAIIFLIVAIIAAVLGFGALAGTAAWIAKVLFVIFVILFIVSLLTGRGGKKPLT